MPNLSHGNQYLRFGSGFSQRRRFHPCFNCMSLEKGAKVVAVLQLVIAAFNVTTFGIALILALSLQAAHKTPILTTAAKNATDPYDEAESVEPLMPKIKLNILLPILFLLVVIHACYTYLQYYLYRGVVERNYQKLTRWWKIMFTITMFLFLGNLFTVYRHEEETGMGGIEFFDFIIDIYSLWVIWEFRQEISLPNTDADATVEFERVI